MHSVAVAALPRLPECGQRGQVLDSRCWTSSRIVAGNGYSMVPRHSMGLAYLPLFTYIEVVLGVNVSRHIYMAVRSVWGWRMISGSFPFHL